MQIENEHGFRRIAHLLSRYVAGVQTEKEERELARDYLCDHYTPDKKLHLAFISLAMRSQARMCIIPLQDYMGLPNRCRINTPSTVGTNWKWRFLPEHMHSLRIRRLPQIRIKKSK